MSDRHTEYVERLATMDFAAVQRKALDAFETCGDPEIARLGTTILKGVGGFLWLGHNLDNIHHDPDVFRRIFAAALLETLEAMDSADHAEPKGPNR